MTSAIEQIEINATHAAIVDAACLAMAIDGVVTQSEIDHMSHYIATMLEVDQEVTHLLIENSLGRIDGTSVEAFLDVVDDRLESAVAQQQALIAVLMAGFSDGVIAEEEERLFFEMAARFGFEEDELEDLIMEAEHFYNQFVEVLQGPSN